jgi:hypothetical protein
MSSPFYGVIEKVESDGLGLTVRCVREYYWGDGLMADDIWILRIEEPQADAVVILRNIVGLPLVDLEIDSDTAAHRLKIYSDEVAEPVAVAAKRISKTEEPRSPLDLEKLVDHLSKRVLRDEAEYVSQSKKIGDCATFVEQLLDRMRKRAEFEAAREGGSPNSAKREIDDLLAILTKLRAPVEHS